MSILSQFALAAEAFKEQSTAAIKTCAHDVEDILADAQAISAKITELQESTHGHKVAHKPTQKESVMLNEIETLANQLQNVARLLMEHMAALEELQPPEPPKVP